MINIESAKILVVDDEPTIVTFYEAALGEQGYQVAVAVNGLGALEQVKSFKPDVILLDVVMPDLTGFEVTERLKRDPATANILIILVTGLGSIEDRVKGLEAGADDFLVKPFNLDELLMRVRSLVKLKKLQDRLQQAEAALPRGGLPAPAALSPRRKPVILVVEDDERIIQICTTVLGSGGYQVASTPDGIGMFTAIVREVPDLIILDLMLPGMDGVEVLAKIKETPLARDIPVVILTAMGDLKTKVKSLYLGADDYLVKPVSSLELLARVRANLRKHEYEQRLKYQLDQTFIQSITDPLTGLHNRRFLESTLERDLALQRRSGHPLCLLMLDIDGFKAINDRHGHGAGDAVLSGLAAIFQREMRASDLAVRMGGDEFLMVLPDARLEQATAIAERLRGAVETMAIPALGGERPTVSIGVCQAANDETGMAALLGKADEALYRAKEGGRNRVAASGKERTSLMAGTTI